MTLLVDILGRAARQCSVNIPSSWLTVTGQTGLEILDFLDQTVTDIRDRVNLTAPMSQTAEIVGTGAETYPLPADFHRLQRGALSVYERLRTRRGCTPVTDDGQWLYLQEFGQGGADRFYRLQGYPGAWTISFQSPLASGLTVAVNYVTANWLVAAGEYKPAFTADEDVCLLPRELVETGIVWRFRQRKGFEYGDVMARHEVLMGRYENDSRTIRRVDFGSHPTLGPFDVSVPDYIPSAT